MAPSDWWARRLSATPPPPPQQAPPNAPTYRAPAGPQQGYNPAPTAPPGEDDFMAAVGSWRGTRRAQEASGHCPECGSGNYFARQYSESGTRLRTEAAGRCFDCGYPLIQAGSSHGSAAGVRAEGPVKQARQLPANHAVTVQEQGGGSYTYRTN